MRVVIIPLGVVLLAICIKLPTTHTILAAGQTSGANAGSIIFGLLLCLPLLGLFSLFRSFSRWHRGFHSRMTTPRPRAR